MVNKEMKKCPMSLAIKEIQIKMTLTLHLTPERMYFTKKANKKCWQECRGKRNITSC
jgi:hypothetical protein